MIEKHRRKRLKRAHPHFVWADPARFHLERMAAGLTQKQAAEYLGVSVRSVRNWETGCNRIPYSRSICFPRNPAWLFSVRDLSKRGKKIRSKSITRNSNLPNAKFFQLRASSCGVEMEVAQSEWYLVPSPPRCRATQTYTPAIQIRNLLTYTNQ